MSYSRLQPYGRVAGIFWADTRWWCAESRAGRSGNCGLPPTEPLPDDGVAKGSQSRHDRQKFGAAIVRSQKQNILNQQGTRLRSHEHSSVRNAPIRLLGHPRQEAAGKLGECFDADETVSCSWVTAADMCIRWKTRLLHDPPLPDGRGSVGAVWDVMHASCDSGSTPLRLKLRTFADRACSGDLLGAPSDGCGSVGCKATSCKRLKTSRLPIDHKLEVHSRIIRLQTEAPLVSALNVTGLAAT